MEFRTPRGTQDRLPEQQPSWGFVLGAFWDRFERAGFGRLDTPLFEDSALFVRAVGEESDIASKETYNFADKSGDSLTLRPEGTAPVVRAYLQHGMASRPQPQRLAYFAPLFRYDRPQAGRLRQHHQIGAEILGEQDPHADVELISQIWWLLTQDLGLRDLTLQLNSIGRSDDRARYLKALLDFLEPVRSDLSIESQRRLSTNPLRILDSKDQRDRKVCESAPRTLDFLGEESESHFAAVKDGLAGLGIDAVLNSALVRGLDYYTDTVFEIWPADSRGQSTVAGGGRYDLLAQQLGGPPTAGIGFGCGVERVLLNLEAQGRLPAAESAIDAYIAPLSGAARPAALVAARDLRGTGMRVVVGYAAGSPRSHLRKANALGARCAVILGDAELASDSASVRDLVAGKQETVARDRLVACVQRATGGGGRLNPDKRATTNPVESG
ncbi:MAG: histidine--tRNA ligase [Chloroflexi bacterium]|nr:histidine--tRNA ligase [Chloroflexota bacterium]